MVMYLTEQTTTFCYFTCFCDSRFDLFQTFFFLDDWFFQSYAWWLQCQWLYARDGSFQEKIRLLFNWTSIVDEVTVALDLKTCLMTILVLREHCVHCWKFNDIFIILEQRNSTDIFLHLAQYNPISNDVMVVHIWYSIFLNAYIIYRKRLLMRIVFVLRSDGSLYMYKN